MKRVFLLLLTTCAFILVACANETSELEGKTLDVFLLGPSIDVKKSVADVTLLRHSHLNLITLRK